MSSTVINNYLENTFLTKMDNAACFSKLQRKLGKSFCNGVMMIGVGVGRWDREVTWIPPHEYIYKHNIYSNGQPERKGVERTRGEEAWSQRVGRKRQV